MRTTTLIAALFGFFAAVPVTAAAQMAQPAPAPSAAESAVAEPTAALQAGPRIETSSVAFQPAVAADSASAAAQSGNSANLGQSRAMMIAGGAAVVVGIIIGDEIGTLIAVSGAVVGLYGLYQYLK